MKLKQVYRDVCHDERGAVLVEASVTMPVFLLLTFGLLQAGLVLWMQSELQHAVDMAARCAGVSDMAGVPPCTSIAATQAYAAATAKAYGLPLSGAAFVVSKDDGTDCGGVPGDLVSVSYKFNPINYIFNLTLSAQSCYPTPP
jgi:hypothetical protein